MIDEPHWTALRIAAEAFDTSHDFQLLPRLEAFIQTGAHAYGTELPGSDFDYLAIVTPSARHILGFGTFDNWGYADSHKLDVKVFSMEKYLRLASQGNPNSVETLFFSPNLYHFTSDVFKKILSNRDAFLSREVYKRYSGYAIGQFKKMESGKYANDMGAKRKHWIDTIGYDPKDASHLARLLMSGGELVRLGRLTPSMTPSQRELVRGIKMGQWSLERVKEWAAVAAEENEAWFNEKNCPLPEQPDLTTIENLLISAHRNAL